jgi:hypothetical protein
MNPNTTYNTVNSTSVNINILTIALANIKYDNIHAAILKKSPTNCQKNNASMGEKEGVYKTFISQYLK